MSFRADKADYRHEFESINLQLLCSIVSENE